MSVKKTRFYSDLDLAFVSHPLTGDISKKVDDQSISQSLSNIIQYNLFEKPFDSNFSSKISNLLFEDFSTRISILIEKYASEIITRYEPRVSILESKVISNETDQSYTYILTYRPINTLETKTTNIYLTRVR